MKSILLGPMVLALALTGATALACDVDADCGVGGTCIKREKRARGVCYGGNPATSPATPAVNGIDPLADPTVRPADTCMVTEECPAGMECVITGIWGRCTVL